jgi:hypothetical protein
MLTDNYGCYCSRLQPTKWCFLQQPTSANNDKQKNDDVMMHFFYAAPVHSFPICTDSQPSENNFRLSKNLSQWLYQDRSKPIYALRHDKRKQYTAGQYMIIMWKCSTHCAAAKTSNTTLQFMEKSSSHFKSFMNRERHRFRSNTKRIRNSKRDDLYKKHKKQHISV